MPRRTPRIPSYRLHKPTGQAVVTLNGKDHYLGAHGTRASRRKYDRLIKEWLANGRAVQPPTTSLPGRTGATIDQLAVAFWDFAQSYYVKDGQPTRELQAIRYALRPLVTLYGDTPVADFGSLKLKAVRQQMIDENLARSLINKRVNRIRHLFKRGIGNELAPPHLLESLRAVAPLKKGRGKVKEAPPVEPAPQHLVDAICPHVARQVWAMVQLQIFTAMRPGEIVTMRRAEIDTSGKVWIYRPQSHKTEHHGHRRLVYLGPRAQRVIMPFLKRADDAFLFSPAEAEQERRQRLAESRRTSGAIE